MSSNRNMYTGLPAEEVVAAPGRQRSTLELLGFRLKSLLWPFGSYGEPVSWKRKAGYVLGYALLVGIACTGVGLIVELALTGAVSLATFMVFAGVGSITTLTGTSAIACGAAICAVIGGWFGAARCKMKTLFESEPRESYVTHAQANLVPLSDVSQDWNGQMKRLAVRMNMQADKDRQATSEEVPALVSEGRQEGNTISVVGGEVVALPTTAKSPANK